MGKLRANLFLLGLLCFPKSFAVNYVFDEFLFSKDTWRSWKLEDPLEDFNPTDLFAKAKETFPGYDQAEYNSLDGPRPRLKSIKRPATVGLASDVEAIDDDNMIEHAAKAAQCMTCHVLASVVWSRLTNEVLGGEDVTREVVRAHLDDACDKEAVDVMLKKYTILKMESAGGLASLTFVVVRERRDTNKGSAATDVEEATVEMACKNLIREAGKELEVELMDQLANFRREAVRLLAKYDRDGGNPPDEVLPPSPSAAPSSPSGSKGSGSSGKLPRLNGDGRGRGEGDDDDDYVDPDDLDEFGDPEPEKTKKRAAAAAAAAGKSKAQGSATASSEAVRTPRVVRGLVFKVHPGESDCADLNPKCGEWARNGECERNPDYMVGTASHRGQCRKACGVCQPEDVLAVQPELAAEVDKLGSALLLAVKNLGCGASGACLTGVSGMAVGTGLIKQQQQQQQPKELPPGMKEFPGGFILGKPWWAVPNIRELSAAEISQRKASSTPPDAASGPDSSASSGTGGSAPSHADVDRVLAPALGNRVLSIPSDFFIYEYLYKNHTRHYHPEPDGTITEDWLLGRFTRESVSLMSSATGEVAGLEELDLLPGSSHTEVFKSHTWPYVKQVYAGGDECVLAGGRRVVRRVEARVACSPDDKTYMLIREPDFCTYTFVIFVPELCELEYYRPRPRTPAGKAAGSGGSRA